MHVECVRALTPHLVLIQKRDEKQDITVEGRRRKVWGSIYKKSISLAFQEEFGRKGEARSARCAVNYERTNGQSSPGILQSGQHPNISREIKKNKIVIYK